jgi:hypothetical protein
VRGVNGSQDQRFGGGGAGVRSADGGTRSSVTPRARGTGIVAAAAGAAMTEANVATAVQQGGGGGARCSGRGVSPEGVSHA